MKHTVILTSVPEKIPTKFLPDGAFTGNGDLNVIWSGAPDRIRLYLSKADFWKALEGDDEGTDGGLSPVCIVEFLLPHLADSPYHVGQDMDGGRVTGTFAAAHLQASLSTIVAEGENTLLIELKITTPGASVSADLVTLQQNGAVCEKTDAGGLQTATRDFCGDEYVFDSRVMAAMREVSRHKDGRELTIRYAVTVVTGHDSANYKSQAVETVMNVDDERFDRLTMLHDRAWRKFWAKSGISIPDEEIENEFYAGLYALKCCAGNGKFPPGLWGAFSTDDGMAWHSDYHLNYNFQAPFYHVTALNHPELTDGYHRAILDYIPYGKTFAKEFLNCRGVYYPVGIGPLGLDTSRRRGTKEHSRLFLGQKCNASFCAVVTAMRWYGTRDLDFAEKTAYPFLRELADFWADYLVYEDGRYVAYNDAIHEVEFWSSPDFMPKRHDEVNNMQTIGLIKCVMRCICDMSEALGMDEDQRGKWRDILEKIGPEPLYEDEGKVYLRATEDGMRDTGLSLQYVYPANELRFDSGEKLWEAARNSFERCHGWESGNQFCSVFPQAVRLGVDTDTIFGKLKINREKHRMPNFLWNYGGGGIENCSAVPGMISEMFLTAWDGVMRIFAVCPWDEAEFYGFRANGAFVVSGKKTRSGITAEILSEKGRDLTIRCPYPDKTASVTAKAGKYILRPSEDLTIPTEAGEVITVK